jgi:hypothetical protein
MSFVLGGLDLLTTGGPLLLNGTVAAARTRLTAPGEGIMVLKGTSFLGSVAIESAYADVHMTQVILLDCQLCHNSADFSTSPREGHAISCICDSDNSSLHFNSHDATLSSTLLTALGSNPHIWARSTHADVTFAELLLMDILKPSGGVLNNAPPSVEVESFYANVNLDGVIASKNAKDTMQVRLSSYAGDIKASFGSALNGTYDVSAPVEAIGSVGIAIDSGPVDKLRGRVGSGNATLDVSHSYGHVALSMDTKPPSVFELIGPNRPSKCSLRWSRWPSKLSHLRCLRETADTTSSDRSRESLLVWPISVVSGLPLMRPLTFCGFIPLVDFRCRKFVYHRRCFVFDAMFVDRSNARGGTHCAKCPDFGSIGHNPPAWSYQWPSMGAHSPHG